MAKKKSDLKNKLEIPSPARFRGLQSHPHPSPGQVAGSESAAVNRAIWQPLICEIREKPRPNFLAGELAYFTGELQISTGELAV